MCICATGKNPGGRGTAKQCGLCKAAGRDGTGHKAPRCPYRNLDDEWSDPSQPRFPATAKEAEARAALAAQKLKDKATKDKKMSAIDLKTKDMQQAAQQLRTEREALSRAKAAKAEQQEGPPSTPAGGKQVKQGKRKRQADDPHASADVRGLSPRDQFAAKQHLRDAVRAQQEAKQEVKRLRRLAEQLKPIAEEEGTAGASSQVSAPPNLPLQFALVLAVTWVRSCPSA